MALQHGHQQRPSNAPRPLPPQQGSGGVKPATPAAELPLAPRAKPTICRNVLVRTPRMIGGQFEHAAIITKVISEDLINVSLMPDGEMPYPVAGVCYADAPAAGAITWRWPPRS